MNCDQIFESKSALRVQVGAIGVLAALAISCPAYAAQSGAAQTNDAKSWPDLAGFYLTQAVSLDDTRWRVEDLACRSSCSLAGFRYLQALLSDPKNNDRSVKILLKEVAEFSKKESIGLMMPEARRRADKYDPADDPVIEQCKPDKDGWKHQLLAPLPMKIDQYDDRVELRYEYWNVVRTAYTDGRGYPSGAAPTRLGHSTGRYDGKTLVVETTGILPNLFQLPGMGSIVHSDQARAIERYTLSDDGNRLDLEWTFIDPVNFRAPVQGQKSFLSSADGELEEFVCEAVTGHF